MILGVLYLSSCSLLQTEKRKNHDPSLVNTFNLSPEELSHVENLQKVEKANQQNTKLKIKIPKVTTKNVQEVKVKKKKDKKKLKSTKVIVNKNQNKIAVRKYPDDYPEKFIEINKSSKKTWDLFRDRDYSGEKFVFAIKYFGVTAGKMVVQTLPEMILANRKAYHFRVTLKSAKFYSYMFKADDNLDSFVDKESFIPLKYSLVQRETNKDVTDLQLFDFAKLKTHFFYNKIKKGKEHRKKKVEYIPTFFQDSMSTLYFLRGLPLNVGEKYTFPLVNRAKVKQIKVFVEKIEKIEVMGHEIEAKKLLAKDLLSGVIKKQRSIVIWFSNDKLHRILKIVAKVKVGTIRGELINYRPIGSR